MQQQCSCSVAAWRWHTYEQSLPSPGEALLGSLLAAVGAGSPLQAAAHPVNSISDQSMPLHRVKQWLAAVPAAAQGPCAGCQAQGGSSSS